MEISNELEFKKEIEEIILPHSTIGVHGVNISNDNKVSEQISSILTNGLIINHPSGMVGNIAFYGTTDDWGYEEVYDYAYHYCSSEKYIVNLVIGIPETFVTNNGDRYLVCLGDAADYRKNKGLQNYNEDVLSNWFNKYISVKRNVPKELIVGVVIEEKASRRYVFKENNYYYGNMTLSEQMDFSDRLINDLLTTEYCYPREMYKISDNNLIKFKKKKDEQGNFYFQSIKSIDISDIKTAIDDLNSYIDLYLSYGGMSTFYLEQVKKYLERKYSK